MKLHVFFIFLEEKNKFIFLCNNMYVGVSELNNPKLSLDEALHDTNRIDYHYRHLCYLQAAIK